MEKKRFTLYAGAAGAALIASVAFITTSASSASADSETKCPKDSFCLFSDTNYRSMIDKFTEDRSDLGPHNKKASSLHNNTAHMVWICADSEKKYTYCAPAFPGERYVDLRKYGWDDKITHFRIDKKSTTPTSGEGQRRAACLNGEVCLWADPDYKGERHAFKKTTHALGNITKKASSLYNNTKHTVKICAGEDRDQKDCHALRPGDYTKDLKRISWDDKVTYLVVQDGQQNPNPEQDNKKHPCKSGYVCLWPDALYGGKPLQVNQNGTYLGDFKASSLQNKTSHPVFFCVDKNPENCAPLLPGEFRHKLSAMDDKIKHVYFGVGEQYKSKF